MRQQWRVSRAGPAETTRLSFEAPQYVPLEVIGQERRGVLLCFRRQLSQAHGRTAAETFERVQRRSEASVARFPVRPTNSGKGPAAQNGQPKPQQGPSFQERAQVLLIRRARDDPRRVERKGNRLAMGAASNRRPIDNCDRAQLIPDRRYSRRLTSQAADFRRREGPPHRQKSAHRPCTGRHLYLIVSHGVCDGLRGPAKLARRLRSRRPRT